MSASRQVKKNGCNKQRGTRGDYSSYHKHFLDINKKAARALRSEEHGCFRTFVDHFAVQRPKSRGSGLFLCCSYTGVPGSCTDPY